MFTADSMGTSHVIYFFAFTVYNIVQCLWKRQKSLKYCALFLFLLWWNVPVQFQLCILKIHSFLLLYIYMCLCMFVQEEKKRLFFIWSLHVLITMCLSSLPCYFIKTTVFKFGIGSVCVCLSKYHIPMKFHVGIRFLYGIIVTCGWTIK